MENGGKSFCRCGHTGDGPGSQHHDDYGPAIATGHGACLVAGCECVKFTWARWAGVRS